MKTTIRSIAVLVMLLAGCQRPGSPPTTAPTAPENVVRDKRQQVDANGRVGERERIETAPLLIPDRARLDFGLGVLPEMKGEGSVTFSISVCAGANCTELLRETLDPAQQSDAWHDRSLSLDAFADPCRRPTLLRFLSLFRRPFEIE